MDFRLAFVSAPLTAKYVERPCNKSKKPCGRIIVAFLFSLDFQVSLDFRSCDFQSILDVHSVFGFHSISDIRFPIFFIRFSIFTGWSRFIRFSILDFHSIGRSSFDFRVPGWGDVETYQEDLFLNVKGPCLRSVLFTSQMSVLIFDPGLARRNARSN